MGVKRGEGGERGEEKWKPVKLNEKKERWMAGVRWWEMKKIMKKSKDGWKEWDEGDEQEERSKTERCEMNWKKWRKEKWTGRQMKGDEKVKDVEGNEKVEWDGWKGRGGAMGDGERDGRYEKMWDGVKWSECKKLGNWKELKEMKGLRWMDRRGEGVTNEMGNEIKIKKKRKSETKTWKKS